MKIATLGTFDYGVHFEYGALVFWRWREVDCDCDSTWFSFHRPRFWSEDHGWSCAPLLRLELHIERTDEFDREWLLEMPWIERCDGKLTFEWVSNSL